MANIQSIDLDSFYQSMGWKILFLIKAMVYQQNHVVKDIANTSLVAFPFFD